MFYALVFAIWLQSTHIAEIYGCQNNCPVETNMVCGFDVKGVQYHMFPGTCALEAFKQCHQVELVPTDLKYCVKQHERSARRMYGESCPVFCPNHYLPVCGVSRIRDYIYRTFNNGCYLDMLSCRGDEDYGYVEVPLEYCQRHAMKNIFKEQVVVSNLNDFHEHF